LAHSLYLQPTLAPHTTSRIPVPCTCLQCISFGLGFLFKTPVPPCYDTRLPSDKTLLPKDQKRLYPQRILYIHGIFSFRFYSSNTGITADIAHYCNDSGFASQPQSLRKLAMSHLIGSSSTDPSSSPIINANGSPNLKGRPIPNPRYHDGSLLPPAAASWSSALKDLGDFEIGSGPRPTGMHYDSPYSRSIPSTAPGSPRM